MTPSLASNDFHGSKHPNGQSKTAEATVVKQQFDSVWAEGRSRSARGNRKFADSLLEGRVHCELVSEIRRRFR